MPILLIAIILGIVEGVTEFIPVSSTGHLILATELLGYDAERWAVFNIVIQLGAILASSCSTGGPSGRCWSACSAASRCRSRFVRNILLAFLPSAVLGFLADQPDRGACSAMPLIVAWCADRRRRRDPR